MLLTGQVSLAQAGFFAVGAYVAAMLTVLAGWPLCRRCSPAGRSRRSSPALVGFPALRVRGLMLVVATLAFGEAVRLFFFNFDYQIARGDIKSARSAAKASARSATSRRTAGPRSR